MAEPASPLLADDGPQTVMDPVIGPVEVPAGQAIPDSANPFIPKPPAGDKPPRGNSQANPANPPSPKRRAKRKAGAVTDAKIREALAELLTAPAVPYSMFRMDWAAQHVIQTGPEFADSLVAYSKTNEWLRDKLEALTRGDNVMGVMIAVFALATASANYIVPLLAYHGLIPREIGARVNGASIPDPPAGMGMPEPPPHFVMAEDGVPVVNPDYAGPGYNANAL